MTGRFLTQKDMRAARRAQDIYNSHMKRKGYNVGSTTHVVCGCGAEGCIFISASGPHRNYYSGK